MNIDCDIAEVLSKIEKDLRKAHALMQLKAKESEKSVASVDNGRWNMREHMIFGVDYEPENYGVHGSHIKHFDGMNLATAEALIAQDFLDPYETQNKSPSVRDFIQFAKDHLDGDFVFHGYVVGPEREDCRVAFEGIESTNMMINKQTIIDFVNMFVKEYPADDYEIDEDRLYCWYD